MNPTRREFLHRAVETGAAGALVAAAVNQVAPRIAAAKETVVNDLIVDTHQHLWDLDRLSLPWHKGAPEVLRRSYRPEDYAAATSGRNVRSVYMEVDVAEADHDKEAEYVVGLSRAKSGAMRAAVIGGRPASPQFGEYVKRHAASGLVKGVRQVLHNDDIPRGICLKDEFVRGVRLLGESGLSFDLCLRPTELADGAKLAELCPDTRFVVDHCGNADPKAFSERLAAAAPNEKPWHAVDVWKQDLAKLAAHKNTICKISGIIARAPKGWTADDLAPIVNYCLDTFGPERVVFGGDWPVCLLGGPLMSWIEALEKIIAGRPAAERTALLSGNAIRFYSLSLE